MKEIRLSFPSGHASFAFQSATFTILFLQSKLASSPVELGNQRLWVPFVQIVVLTMATFTAVSRVMDYKHHPTDVLAGSIIGIITQTLNVLAVTDLFFKVKPNQTRDSNAGEFSMHEMNPAEHPSSEEVLRRRTPSNYETFRHSS